MSSPSLPHELLTCPGFLLLLHPHRHGYHPGHPFCHHHRIHHLHVHLVHLLCRKTESEIKLHTANIQLLSLSPIKRRRQTTLLPLIIALTNIDRIFTRKPQEGKKTSSIPFFPHYTAHYYKTFCLVWPLHCEL